MNLKHKVAYIDQNFEDHFEDYSYTPTVYGGGRICAGPMMQFFNNFYVFSNQKSFQNVLKEKKNQCFVLDWPSREKIRNGVPVKDVIPNAHEYDIFFHHTTDKYLNLEGLKAKQLVWSVGWRETINENHKNLALFTQEYQQPSILGNPKIHDIVIGPKLESFQEYKKEDLVFNCTRHNACFQSIELAQIALNNKIQTIFAGPIEKNYPLLKYIDGKTTHYLGCISLEEKIKYNKLAKAHIQLQQYPTAWTLSSKESMSYGTPTFALPIGQFPSVIKNGVNGYIVCNQDDILAAWDKRNDIKQLDCYNSVLFTSEENMINSLVRTFDNLV